MGYKIGDTIEILLSARDKEHLLPGVPDRILITLTPDILAPYRRRIDDNKKDSGG
jgi:hypothetical protein